MIDLFCLWLGRIVCVYLLVVMTVENYRRVDLWLYWRRWKLETKDWEP